MGGLPRGVDVVVVGAGHNGLVAANLLADEGLDVLVLEAADTPGGAVRTAEVTAPGFRNDLFSAFYPLTAASPVIAGLDLGSYGLRWCHAPTVLTHITPDDRAVTLSRDVDETAESVERWAAGDGDAWRAMYEDFARLAPHVIDALLQPFPPVRPALGLLRELGIGDAIRRMRFGILPVRRFVDEEFSGEGAKLLLTGNALHGDLAPASAAGGVFGWLLAMLGQHVGFPSPEGGAGMLVEALVARLRVRGGEVVCGQRVDRIAVRNGRAVGVQTAGGERVLARRAVLADVAAPMLFRDLVGDEHLPPRFVDDIKRFAWDDATLKLNWAVSAPIPWTAKEAGGSGTVHLGVDLDGLTYYAADLQTGRIPENPFLLLGQMTTTDPSRSPAGTESVWAYTHLPRSLAYDDDVVRQHVERVEAVVERHAPGFRDLVLARQVQTPGELEGADANLSAGAVNGGTAALHQQLIFRPAPGLARPETPVRGLYLAGASAHPGGGVHGAPGSNAAKAVLLRSKPLGRVRAGAISAAMRQVTGRAK